MSNNSPQSIKNVFVFIKKKKMKRLYSNNYLFEMLCQYSFKLNNQGCHLIRIF